MTATVQLAFDFTPLRPVRRWYQVPAGRLAERQLLRAAGTAGRVVCVLDAGPLCARVAIVDRTGGLDVIELAADEQVEVWQ